MSFKWVLDDHKANLKVKKIGEMSIYNQIAKIAPLHFLFC